MKRNLYLKCNKCQELMNYDYYCNKFICKCNNKIDLESIKTKEDFVIVDFGDDILENSKKLDINLSKDDFVAKIKHRLKYRFLLPNSFLKLKKKEINSDLIYVPLIIYEAKCVVIYDSKDIKNSVYEVSNVIFDEYSDFDNDILKSLYPIDLYSKIEGNKASFNEIDKKNVLELDKIRESIQIKIKEKIKDFINIEINDKLKNHVIILEEKYECVYLPIYDLCLNYKNNQYHLSMNANTGKISFKFPVSNFKLFLITILFIYLDLIYFYICHLIEVVENYCIVITFFVFVIQFLLIIYFYFSTKEESIDNNKNKSIIKKID